MIDLKKLIEAGVHFGHKTSRWNPKMEPFIWGHRNNIHLINVKATGDRLEKAAQFLESIASTKKSILFVGTKKVAQEPVATVGQRLKLPYVIHRWIGGTLTNNSQVKKSITKLLHFEDIVSKSDQHLYTKKEYGVYQKMVDRLMKNVGSIRNFTMPVGAVVLVDVKKEQTALREANAMGIPVVALVDTNSDPSMVNYPIPGNDDAVSSIRIMLDYLADAVARGQEKAAQLKEEQAAAAAAARIEEDAQMLPAEGSEEEEKRARTRKKAGDLPKAPEAKPRRAPAFKPRPKKDE
ncbi:30S ribosomal protein S2 [Candidatus Dependentiae bacterium]|nr:30S ribosomal protein S2 [Candidatus Dependentiae bacterium]